MERPFAVSEAQSSRAFRLGDMALDRRLFITQWSPRAGGLLPLGFSGQGGGLLISAPLSVSATSEEGTARLALCTSEQVNRWREVTCAAHQQGGFLCARLTHSAMPVRPGHRGPSDGDLQRCFEAFRDAAENAIDAGFDGIELAAGQGTVGGQLLGIQSTLTAELLQVLVDVWGSRCCLGIHLGPDGGPFLELEEQLRGELTWLHLGPCTATEAGALSPSWRKYWSGALLVSGGFNAEGAQALLDSGWVNMVGVEARAIPD